MRPVAGLCLNHCSLGRHRRDQGRPVADVMRRQGAGHPDALHLTADELVATKGAEADGDDDQDCQITAPAASEQSGYDAGEKMGGHCHLGQ